MTKDTAILVKGFSIEKDPDGHAVKFPKALLNQFKSNFRNAVWRSHSSTWLIGSRSKKKFEVWANEMAESLIQIEELDNLDTAKKVENFIIGLQITKVQVLSERIDHYMREDDTNSQHNRVKDELSQLEANVEQLENMLKNRIESKKLLLAKSKDIDALQEKRNALKKQAQEELNEIEEIVNKAIDIKEVKKAFDTLKQYFGKIGSQNRRKFEEAQAQLREQQDVLHTIGLHSKGLYQMCSMNINRPDRDPLPYFSKIYDVEEYSEDDED